MRALTVRGSGPLATVQDLGRPGYAHLGVPASGAADRGSLRLANRLLGNPDGAAGIEVSLGGFSMRADDDLIVAVTGPPARVTVDGRGVGCGVVVPVPADGILTVETPLHGCRNYLAVRGGLDVERVLGSASSDTLSGLGPDAVRPGDVLAVGEATAPLPAVGAAPTLPMPMGAGPVVLTASAGPRADRLENAGSLFTGSWTVDPASNRVGVRLNRAAGEELRVRGAAEAASEGVPLGAVQIPPSGQPVLFLADHPVTGGYPVIAVLTAASVDAAAQLTAGVDVRFRRPN
ncbi:MAG: biotin-dependent carboxyltransferase family protein [Gordonia sp. (in: high G+C Gram-positive bacteria)]|uniref:5-oxoprolinase subunit C family protein n=1 Tax=Gordonia sp. (in: high G+C Gram-positive bacteria) TaxID=84139 RepID=UPI0039E2B80F